MNQNCNCCLVTSLFIHVNHTSLGRIKTWCTLTTDCAANASHPEITKSYGQDSRTDTPPPSSHGSYKPIDEYPTALREEFSCGNKAGAPTANRTTTPVSSCCFTPSLTRKPLFFVSILLHNHREKGLDIFARYS